MYVINNIVKFVWLYWVNYGLLEYVNKMIVIFPYIIEHWSNRHLYLTTIYTIYQLLHLISKTSYLDTYVGSYSHIILIGFN